MAPNIQFKEKPFSPSPLKDYVINTNTSNVVKSMVWCTKTCRCKVHKKKSQTIEKVVEANGLFFSYQ